VITRKDIFAVYNSTLDMYALVTGTETEKSPTIYSGCLYKGVNNGDDCP